ncbi:MAG: type II toxin-antitoxin system RelE/ParE family toxin [Nevskia sp.]|nr:type II toxin-antitoxin system RelE/ParE family toxin [Nevskia sp.]
MPYTKPLFTFVELPPFSKVRELYLSDDEFGELQRFITEQPDAGDVIPGSGGCRKLRWSAPGRGKRGGVRVIYFLRLANGQVVLVMLYAKNVTANIDAGVLKAIRKRHDDEQETKR